MSGAAPASVGVGEDAAAVALNAAALQTLSHQPPQAPLVRINNGSVYWAKRPALLNGAESSDVSYLADEVGHGLQARRSVRRGVAFGATRPFSLARAPPASASALASVASRSAQPLALCPCPLVPLVTPLATAARRR